MKVIVKYAETQWHQSMAMLLAQDYEENFRHKKPHESLFYRVHRNGCCVSFHLKRTSGGTIVAQPVGEGWSEHRWGK